jgi:hypothetical protein
MEDCSNLTARLRFEMRNVWTRRGPIAIRTMTGLGAIVFSAAASAGSVTDATITGIGITEQIGSMAFISVSIAKSGNPTCHNNGTWSFVLPLTTPLQNQMFAQLLAARAAQSPVTLTGNGLCDTFGGVETLVYVIN